MRNAFTTWVVTLMALVTFAVAGAQASELDDRRAAGLIVERYDGFVEPANANAPADIRALVERVNAQRRDIYEKRAAENDVPMAEVAKLYAIEILENAPSGTLFKGPDGKITRKE